MTIGLSLLAALAIWLIVGAGIVAVRTYVRLLGWRDAYRSGRR